MFLSLLNLLLRYGQLSFFSTNHAPHSLQILLFQHAVTTPISVLISCIHELEQNNTVKSTELKRVRLAIQQLRVIADRLSCTSLRPQKSNLKNMVKTIVVMLRSKNEDIIFTDVSKDNTYSILPIHEIRLQEALTCVINNALAANKKSGLPVHITYYREKSRYRITIRDFGPGMNIFVQRLAYLPLFSLRGQGKGLGLYFARQVIENELNGSLQIYSQPSLGTLIECVIPEKIQMNNQIRV